MRLPSCLVMLTLAAGVLEAGCGENGGSSRNASGEDGGETGEGGQTTGNGDGGTYTLGGLDDPCPGGLTGRQLLALIAPGSSGRFTETGASQSTALTVDVTYGGGTITCTPASAVSCCNGCPCARPSTTLSVDLDVTFRTADGTFDERLSATATVLGTGMQGNWSASLPVADIAGTYHAAAWSTHLEFDGSFTAATMTGGISEMSSQMSTGIGDWTASPSNGNRDAGAD